MFLNHYILLESAAICKSSQVAATFSNESKLTDYLKKITRNAGWKYLRVDTTNQMGFPDILLLKKKTYWQIEAKILRKKKLVSLEDDLKWQFGQIGYMKRALTLNLNYMLVVGKESSIAFIKGDHNGSECSDYPDFVGQL